MTFRVTVKQEPLTIEFEASTLAELNQVLLNGTSELSQAFKTIAGIIDEQPDESPAGTGAKRGRRSNKDKAAEAAALTTIAPPAVVPAPPPPAAVAPAPILVPPVAVDTAETVNGIPKFMDRTGAPVAAPPPIVPPAAPAPVPATKLADLVVADLKKRATGAVDGGKALVDWLAQSGLVIANSTFDEATTVISFLPDEKIAPVAKALGVTA